MGDLQPADVDVAVVGAGVIGVACALQLARQGLRVQVFDPDGVGQGASFGNAGHLATEQVFPIADLSILKRLPGMLLDPMGPLRLDWTYLPRATPWFLRLLLNLRAAPFARTVAGLRALNEASLGAWRRLLQAVERPDLLREDGSLLVYEQDASRVALQALQARMAGQGVPVESWGRRPFTRRRPSSARGFAAGCSSRPPGTSSTRTAWSSNWRGRPRCWASPSIASACSTASGWGRASS